MPSRPLCTPDTHVPDDAQLIGIVRKRPGVSLRELAAAVWPDCPWTGPGSVCDRLRAFQAPYGVGNRIVQQSAAEYLRDALGLLVERGALRYAPRRRDEISLAASVAFVAPGVEVPDDRRDVIAEAATARRAVL